ncbi:MAG: S9 family peptidase, partial [Bacteroidetes bacterium]|nr:S9 family peptidase [Bacteroidota bacterium]
LSPRGDFIIDAFTSSTIPREYRIVNNSTQKSVSVYKSENPVKEYKLGQWSLFTIKNSEGTDLFCRMFKPVDFDSTKKYPVVVYLYNGPHSQMVTNTWMAGGELWYQYMAQKGFIIFTLDGRGTSNRGKAFEQSIHRQLGTKEMEDQLKGVDYLKSLPYVDAARMGVHGWSFGGFMTTSLMTRNAGVFKVGVAGGPVIDWSYYEIMYGERYMDSPKENKEGYEQNNLLNYVQNLKGKLLMIHGAQDNVVVLQHSILYQKKAVEKGIQLDFYVYPGHEHNVLGKDRAHLMEKVCNYFIDNL